MALVLHGLALPDFPFPCGRRDVFPYTEGRARLRDNLRSRRQLLCRRDGASDAYPHPGRLCVRRCGTLVSHGYLDPTEPNAEDDKSDSSSTHSTGKTPTTTPATPAITKKTK
jgi:hypothetical protein